MEIKSLQTYNEKAREIDNSKLGIYRNQLNEQLKYYEEQLERAKVLDLSTDIASAKSRIALIKEKMDKPVNVNGISVNGIDESILIPLAENVWQEGAAIKHKLQQDIQAQWGEAHKARDKFLEELKKIREIKDHSINVAREASSVCGPLRRNPFEPLRIGNQNKFVISLDEINSLLGER